MIVLNEKHLKTRTLKISLGGRTMPCRKKVRELGKDEGGRIGALDEMMLMMMCFHH